MDPPAVPPSSTDHILVIGRETDVSHMGRVSEITLVFHLERREERGERREERRREERRREERRREEERGEEERGGAVAAPPPVEEQVCSSDRAWRRR